MPKTTDRILLIIGTGSDAERHLVDPGKFLLSETIVAERATRMLWPQIWIGVNTGQTVAIQAVIWLMRKRHNPKLKLSDVEFAMGEYQLKDPDYDPEHWIPDGDDDELPAEVALINSAFDADEGEDPKERPQDTTVPELPEG